MLELKSIIVDGQHTLSSYMNLQTLASAVSVAAQHVTTNIEITTVATNTASLLTSTIPPTCANLGYFQILSR